MDRTGEIKVYLTPFWDKWMEEKTRKCRNSQEPGLLKQAERMLLRVIEEQRRGDRRQLCYISLFHLRSSLYTGTNRYRICALDETLYLNPPLASASWIPEQLYHDKPALRGLVETELRKCFVRLTPYEIDYAVRYLLQDYHKLAEVYWSRAAEQLVQTEEFSEVRKQEDWVILSGTYMENMKLVLQSENRRW